MISAGEYRMRQVKRVFYIVLLNVIITIITVGVVIKLWEKDHPPLTVGNTPIVIVVTSTPPGVQPINANEIMSGTIPALEAGIVITGTIQSTPTAPMLTYRVKEGDILSALAVQFGVSAADIMAVNNLTDPDSLYIGQIIYIPTGPLPTVTPTASPTSLPSITPKPSATVTPGPSPTSTPTKIGQEARLIIDKVIGAGVLETERVVLRRMGDGELSLAGWRLTDDQGNDFIFPQLTLYKDGAVNLNTRTGENTVVDLFWGLSSPIWRAGMVISIYDSQKNLHASYTLP